MAAALVAVVLSLVIDHLAPAAQTLRRHADIGRWFGVSLARGEGQSMLGARWGWLPWLLAPVLLLWWLQWLVGGWLFGLLGFLLQLAVLFLCWGPRDLDLDVEAVASAGDADSRSEALRALSQGRLQTEDDATAWVRTVFRQGLERWFGVLFWFLLLGAAGALLYRLSKLLSAERAAAPEGQREPIQRTAALLDWPVAHLMCLALALAAHFDSVLAAWRDWHAAREEGRTPLDLGFLDACARASVREDIAAAEADGETETGRQGDALRELRDAMALVWRILLVWLSVLALFVLAGYVG